MCDKALLVSYLYDDLGDADRASFDAHLRDCAECRGELNALRGVRADLISWSPPQSDFGFRIVPESRALNAPGISNVVQMTPRSAHPASWRAWWTPAAGLAAAAILVLAAAAGLARIEIHTGPAGVTVRTGWSAFAPASDRSAGETGSAARASGHSAGEAGRSGDVAARDVPLPSMADADLIAAIDRRLRALETATRAAAPDRNAAMPTTASARASDAEIIRRVREMLAQSETKQQGELALRVAQVLRDVDAQRVADLTRIQQGLRGIEASVSAEAAGHRELTNYILTSARQK